MAGRSSRRFPTKASSVNLGGEEDFIELVDEVGDLLSPFLVVPVNQ